MRGIDSPRHGYPEPPPQAGKFQRRLARIQKAANMTVADLARWYRRPHATVRCWTQGTVPGGGPRDREDVAAATTRIETLVERKVLPLPYLPRAERLRKMEYLRRLK